MGSRVLLVEDEPLVEGPPGTTATFNEKGGKNQSSTVNVGRFYYVKNPPTAIPRNWAYQNYSASQQSGGSAQNGLKIRFTVDRTTIQGSGSTSPGSTEDRPFTSCVPLTCKPSDNTKNSFISSCANFAARFWPSS